MTIFRQKAKFSWTLIIIYIIVSVVVIAGGSLYIRNLKKSIISTKSEELLAYNDLKISQIVRWWHERIGDGIIIRDNELLTDCIDDFLNLSRNEYETKVLDSLLRTYIRIFDYYGGVITDNSGTIKLSVPQNQFNSFSAKQSLVPDALRTDKVMLTDIYTNELTKSVQLDLVIPVESYEDGIIKTFGKVIFTINPEKILFPIIESWPAESLSAETLLLRLEGDSVVFINRLKHIDNKPLEFKRPLSDTNLLGAKAVLGKRGIAEGTDYRGVKVIGALRNIPGTSWFIISKVDTAEVGHEVWDQILPIYIMMLLVISGLGAAIGWTLWHQRVRYYRMIYEAEVEKSIIRKHFDYIIKNANDLILLVDTDLKIVEANDRALEVYQYSRDELIGMNIRKLRDPKFDSQLDEKLELLNSDGAATYETIHVRKDGSIFPVEISARRFDMEGLKYYQSIGRDISERRKIEANLNLLLERYNLATRSAKLAVWDWDVKNDILTWADRVYELFGVSEGDYLPSYNMFLRKVLHPEDLEKVNNDIQNALSGKTDYDSEFRIIMPDHSIKYIKAFGQVLRNPDGSPERMIGINYDVTEQRVAQNMLQEREFWLTESQKVGKVGSYVLDIPALIWSSSEVLDEIFGINENFVRNLEGWNQLIHPAEKQEMMDYVRYHVIGGKNTFDKEYRIINHKTGKTHWVWGRGELRFDINGIPVKMIGTIQDITEKKVAELSLEITEQTYTDLFDSVTDAIYIHKPDGVFIDVNVGAVKMYGYPKNELVGMSPATVGAPGRNDMEELDRILKKVFETGKSEQFEFWGQRENGEIFPKDVVSNKGKYFGEDVLISTARDITLRKRYEDELKKSKEKAEESDRLKTAFLHNISHEIRTPMNAIVGFTALLDEPDIDSESRKHFISIITQSTNQLLGIISDIVDISNIETGQVRLNLGEVNINTLMKNLYDQFSINAEQQKLLFYYDTKLHDDKATIYTDRTKLVQIISNLLNNSFKFTRQGSVGFGYRVNEHDIEFYVKDTGIGVPEDKFERIFERFYQVEIDSSRRYSGAGLGLSISKAYAEMLGGRIWLISSPEKGSEFIFNHPI